jgi:hypothetical protein
MTLTSSQQAHGNLRRLISHAEREAQRLLGSGTAPLDVVIWLSAHIAAVDHSVYPVVKRSLPDGAAVVARHREIASRLSHRLRDAESYHSGDMLASGMSPQQLSADLRRLVTEHLRAEGVLIRRLIEALTDDAQAVLMTAYADALEHAPTRPHPHLHRGGLMFRLDRWRDRVLDTMDGRHVPLPRAVKAHVTPGRWGAYLLGQPHQSSDAS